MQSNFHITDSDELPKTVRYTENRNIYTTYEISERGFEISPQNEVRYLEAVTWKFDCRMSA